MVCGKPRELPSKFRWLPSVAVRGVSLWWDRCSNYPMDDVAIELAKFLYAHPQPIWLATVLEHVLLHGGQLKYRDREMQHLLHDLLSSPDALMHALCQHASVSEWVSMRSHQVCTEELQALVQKENGWHFSALQAEAGRITSFKLETMAAKTQTIAPTLWHLLTALTHANRRTGQAGAGGDDRQGRDAEEEFLAHVEGLEEESLLGRTSDNNEIELRRANGGTIERRRETVHNVVRVQYFTADKNDSVCSI